jgi:hypothetical protein
MDATSSTTVSPAHSSTDTALKGSLLPASITISNQSPTVENEFEQMWGDTVDYENW